FFQHRQALVRDGHDADVRLDRGERVVRRQRRFLSGQRVKQCRFSNVGQTNNSSLKHIPDKSSDFRARIQKQVFYLVAARKTKEAVPKACPAISRLSRHVCAPGQPIFSGGTTKSSVHISWHFCPAFVPACETP